MLASPAFGEADLTNCERELIHLAGSVQPHGVLLALREPCLNIIQTSSNALVLLGVSPEALLNRPLDLLGSSLQECVAKVASSGDIADPVPVTCRVSVLGKSVDFEGTVHRIPGAVLLVEICPVDSAESQTSTVSFQNAQLVEHLGLSVDRFSDASTIGTLADSVVKRFRDMLGYDRVMVYKFDPDGHGKIIAEARDPRLDTLLGHHYPSTDIPQRARELYVRNRLRVLVNVHYEAAALVPRQLPGSGEELDMSMCHLRSMSPLHLQYLKNMGVTATLVVSLVREGKLWGLIACHHYTPRNLSLAVRAAADLLAEVVSTRIAAIENYVSAQVAVQVRRLEQRLIEATSTEGDWRQALFRHPQTLLRPLDATGAALFYEDEILTSGEVPSTPELRALARWVHEQEGNSLYSCSSVERANPGMGSLTPTASGVIAVKLSTSRADYLMWFRKEQLLSVTWAGDPGKPVVGNDPLELSPRRSFAAWSEMVRGTALSWTSSDIALARAFGDSLIDIILQVNAVRLLIAEHQVKQTRATVANSHQSVVIADAQGRVVFANSTFTQLVRRPRDKLESVVEIAALFSEPEQVSAMLASLALERQAWRGQLELQLGDCELLPVSVRAEVVPARDGSILGFFLIFEDLTNLKRAAEARLRLEQSLSMAGLGDEAVGRSKATGDRLIAAVLANASLAAMDIAEGSAAPAVASLLGEIDSSTRRAAALYTRIRSFNQAR